MKWERTNPPWGKVYLADLDTLESAEREAHGKVMVVTRVFGGFMLRVYEIEYLHTSSRRNLLMTTHILERDLH